MGRITYEMVTDFVKERGTPNTHDIYEHIATLVPEYSTKRITEDVGRKIRTLVKYKILARMTVGRTLYVYLEGTVPEPEEEEKLLCDIVLEHLETVEVGSCIRTKDIMEAYECSKHTVHYAMKRLGGFVYDTKTRTMRRVRA